MTKLEVIKEHQKQYAETLERISDMNGLEKSVAKNIILVWIKGHNWLGGLSDSVAEKAYHKVMIDTGCTFEEIDIEVQKQMGIHC